MKLRKVKPEKSMKEKPSNELGHWGGKGTEKEHVTIKIKRPQDSHYS